MNTAEDQFYAVHRGGSGNVVAVLGVYDDDTTLLGIFGSIETARAWADQFDDDECKACIFTPWVVDEPDFGNAETH